MSYGAGIDFTGIAPSAPAIPSGLFTAANNGLSRSTVNALNVVFGQNVGQVGSPAALISSREIPMAGFNIQLGLDSTGQLILRPLLVRIRDNLNANVITLFPTRNTSGIGVVGQYLSNIGIVNTVEYTNAASTGQVVDYSSNSDIHISNGAVNAVAFGAKPLWESGGGTGDCIAFFSDADVNKSAGATGVLRGFYHKPTIATLAGSRHIAFENVTGDNFFNTVSIGTIGRTGIRLDSSSGRPTAFLHIGNIGSDGNPGNASFKIDPGTLLGAVEDGAMEYDGVHFYLTIGATRKQIALV